MEEILASIRRILSEDETTAGAAGAEPPAATKGEDGVLQLTEEMLAEPKQGGPEQAPAAVAPVPAPPEPPPMPAAAAPPPAPPPGPVPPLVAAPAQAPALSFPSAGFAPLPTLFAPVSPLASDGLLEAGTAAAAAAALGQLARGPAIERAVPGGAWPLGNGGLTVEELVRQELRPLLSAWLNANLPGIVEEAVAREMERVRARIG